jgi:hypothetical protein
VGNGKRYTEALDVSLHLAEAAEHFLLRKVSGGYIIVHRRPLEYFATLDTSRSDFPYHD